MTKPVLELVKIFDQQGALVWSSAKEGTHRRQLVLPENATLGMERGCTPASAGMNASAA